MHLVFIDPVPWPYRIDAPLVRPIGGTQSALCYLMMALAARGVKVSLINAEVPHEFAGVRGLSSNFPADAIADADALVMVSDPTPASIAQLAAYAPRAKKILWQHHAADQPVVQMLSDPAVVSAWDEIVFVSTWQEAEYLKTFPALAARPRKILRNAIAPAFENLFVGLPVLPFKSPVPRLAYNSTPFRGLDRLLYGWQQILSAHPSVELQIFSSMKLYNAEDTDYIAQILDTARSMPGVTHVGPVAQAELAQALRGTLILSYPNTFPETACIAVMEAMAAGCVVITSDLGALPETLGGHGVLLPIVPDAAQHAQDFAAALAAQITQLKSQWQSGELESRLAAQVKWANENYVWAARAMEWQNYLSTAN